MTQLLRGLFNGYFIVMSVAGVVSAVGYVISGRPVFAIGALAVVAVAVMARRWFLQHMDVELQARAAGAAAAVPRLRALHLKGMLLNAILLATVVANVPLVV